MSLKRFTHFWHMCHRQNLCTSSGKFLLVIVCRPESWDFLGVWLTHLTSLRACFRSDFHKSIREKRVSWKVPLLSKQLWLFAYNQKVFPKNIPHFQLEFKDRDKSFARTCISPAPYSNIKFLVKAVVTAANVFIFFPLYLVVLKNHNNERLDLNDIRSQGVTVQSNIHHFNVHLTLFLSSP